MSRKCKAKRKPNKLRNPYAASLHDGTCKTRVVQPKTVKKVRAKGELKRRDMHCE